MSEELGAKVPDAAMAGSGPSGAETVDGVAVDTLAEVGLFERLLDLIALGGPVVVVLLGMSVFALTIVVLKVWQFWRLEVDRRGPARRALSLHGEGRVREARDVAAASRNPVAQVAAHAIEGLGSGTGDRELLREDAARLGADLLEDLRGYLRPLEVIAALSPLLGLFGTVLGMIDAFHALEQAGNNVDPATLSGGIWVALLTTAVGLGVAMPVVVLLNWLERRVERVAHEMDSALSRIFTEAAA